MSWDALAIANVLVHAGTFAALCGLFVEPGRLKDAFAVRLALGAIAVAGTPLTLLLLSRLSAGAIDALAGTVWLSSLSLAIVREVSLSGISGWQRALRAPLVGAAEATISVFWLFSWHIVARGFIAF